MLVDLEAEAKVFDAIMVEAVGWCGAHFRKKGSN
jgi:hypothetical protein